jgi:carboxypeptidase C (cathepsin A)
MAESSANVYLSELGPCNVTENLTSQVNPYSWSEVSNLLFLSQPLGVGFSYGGLLSMDFWSFTEGKNAKTVKKLEVSTHVSDSYF